MWSLVPPGTKELRELNICEKNCEIINCEMDLEKGKHCRQIANDEIVIALTF